MPALIVATRNTHKTSEIRKLLGPSFSILDLSTRADWPEIVENGATFTENACLKALAISRVCQDLVLADDSGLEVDALHATCSDANDWLSNRGRPTRFCP